MRTLALLACAPLTCAGQTPRFVRDAGEAIRQAIAAGLIPGAVLLVGHAGRTVYRQAYGSRALVPKREPMTEDTIFDLASLTKVLATTPCLMRLLEEGKLRIDDKVTAYLPEFQAGHSDITIRDLMTHFSGLRPDLDLEPAWSGYGTGIQKALLAPPAGPAGVKFVYSDINFILLGEIVHRLSGKTLDRFAEETVYGPLGMKDTMFLPPAALRDRIAPTEIDPATGAPLRGVVHDETSRFMGGVAGHAGLFSTADDLGRFARMMLDGGEANGARLFGALTIHKFTTPQSPPGQPVLRGLGWDIDSPFSSNRGDLFPLGSYGHTGFTGTDLWIDPASRTYLIFLTNAVHPHRGKSIVSLRSRIANMVAAEFGNASTGAVRAPQSAPVLTGLDVLAARHFEPLRGRHIGLITNHTGLSRDGKRNADLMLAAGLDVKAIFSPEHGFAGVEDRENVGNTHYGPSNIPVWSLYRAKRRRPTAEMLDGIDTLVFDIQDVGARFYTYSCTMIYAMEEAAPRHIAFWVLDRPNPITGEHVEGPLPDPALESFVGCAAVPVRHGFTLGELARFVNGERHLGVDLHVVPIEGWRRGEWFDETGLTWTDPSPNMRGLNAALLYPGLALLEASSNYSVGRGTDAPFEQIGADWIDGRKLADFLNGRNIAGIRVYATRFTPGASNFQGKEIEGVRFVVVNRDALDSVGLGIEVACALERLFPGKIPWRANRWLIGNERALRALETGSNASGVARDTTGALENFLRARSSYLLY